MGTTLRRALVAGLAAVTLLLAGCAAGDPEPVEPEPLTATQAGGLYLSAVCPVNTAWDDVDLELDRLRLAVGRGDADPRALARALTDVAEASERATQALDPADAGWPAQAAPAIAEVRDTLRADRSQALRVAKLPAEELAVYEWQGSGEIAEAAATARSALALPADAATACAQWDAQQAERAEEDRSSTDDAESTK